MKMLDSREFGENKQNSLRKFGKNDSFKISRKYFGLIFVLVLLVGAGFVDAQRFISGGDDKVEFSGSRLSTSSFVTARVEPGPDLNDYYSGERLSTYFPILDDDPDSCQARKDVLLLQVPPAGCQPAVARSDLLAEQNVPVFCQLSALKVNP